MSRNTVTIELSFEEMDRLLLLLTATQVLAVQNGNEKMEHEANRMVIQLSDSDFRQRMRAHEMQQAISEKEGCSYYEHSLAKVKDLLEMK